MFKFKRINTKLAIFCYVLAALICTATCIVGYYYFRNNIYKTYNDFAYQIGEISLSYVDGDTITSYIDTENKREIDEKYETMAQNIYKIYKNSSLYERKSGIYICVPSRETMTLTNIFDVRIMEADEETKKAFEIGVQDPIGVDNTENSFAVFETGERVDDYFIHETKFGYNSSAILPIKNSKGEVVAQLVADMPIPMLNEILGQYLLNIIGLTLLIVLVFVTIFIILMQYDLIKPIKNVAGEAKRFTESDIENTTVIEKTKRNDEIGLLVNSVSQMETDIKHYVKDITEVTAEKERIGAELDVAKNIQASMLPCIFPPFPERDDFDIYATMTPAKEVGGDFYDFFMIDNRHLAIVMADVSGKGIPAALFMVIGKTLIKDHTGQGRDLGDVFSEVNNLLCESNSQELFITAFEGVLDLVTGEFRFVNAGHEMPFIYKKSEGYKPYKINHGFVLAGMENMKYKSGVLNLEPGDRLFQYTDGVTEATDKNENLYGMGRLEDILNKCIDKTPKDTLLAVKEDIDAFVGEAPQFDDITMLCVEYKKKLAE
ncbi:MAG: SpoIIE family protein phosphatase [Clostridia bacterium]|nr:SpoIIE family protein phosphatase [Clostridia bacterium]